MGWAGLCHCRSGWEEVGAWRLYPGLAVSGEPGVVSWSAGLFGSRVPGRKWEGAGGL